MADLEIITTQIAAGSVVSAPVPTGIKTAVGIAIPSGYVGGALKFNTSIDGGSTWLPLFDASNALISISAPGAGTFIALNPATFAGVNLLQIAITTAPSSPLVFGLAVRAVAF
jgi:hypothetical protein